MADFQTVLDQIPIRHGWISMIMLGGVIQGLMISLVVALRSNKHNQPIQFLGWFIFCLSLIGFDIYLGYTGLMKYTLCLNDSTEFLVLLLGPLIYFFAYGLLKKERITWKKTLIHLLIPVLYLISQIGYLMQPDNVKLNAYIGGFYKNVLPFVDFERSKALSYSQIIKDELRLIILFSFILYFFLSGRLIWENNKNLKPVFNFKSGIGKYRFSSNAVLAFGFAFLFMLTVFLKFDSDLGDHLIAIFFSICIYAIAFSMLSQSQFFEKAWLSDKYDTSGLNVESDRILEKALIFVKEQEYFLEKAASLKDLATQLEVPPNYLSQVINEKVGKNFNDFINEYRVEEAKKRIVNPAYAHLNIAGIGETVGFNSKSAFYAAFKKYTAMTPAAYLKSVKTS